MVKNFQIKIQIYYANRRSWALLNENLAAEER